MAKKNSDTVTLTAALSPDYKKAFTSAAALVKDAEKDLKALEKTQSNLMKLQDLAADVQRAEAGEQVKNIEKKRQEFARLADDMGIASADAETLAQKLADVTRERGELASVKRLAAHDMAIAKAAKDVERLRGLQKMDPKYADALASAEKRAEALGIALADVSDEMQKKPRQKFTDAIKGAAVRAVSAFKALRDQMKKPIKQQFTEGIEAGLKGIKKASAETWEAMKKGAALAARGAVAAFKKAAPALKSALGKGLKFAGGAALGAVGAVAGGIGGALGSAEEQAEQYKLAAASGYSREDFSDVIAAMKKYNLDAAAFMDLTKTTQERVAEAVADWGSEQGKTFEKLGFERDKLGAMQSADALKAIADAVMAIENSAERTKATEDLLGGDARILLEDLRAQGKTFSGFLGEYAGKGLKAGEIEALEKSADMMRELKQNLAKFVARFLDVIGPALERMMPAVQSLAAAFEPLIPPLMRGAGVVVSLLGYITRGVGKIVSYIGEIGVNDDDIIGIGRAIETAGDSMIDVRSALSTAADALEKDIERRRAAEASKTEINISYKGGAGENIATVHGGRELVSRDAALSSVVSLGENIANQSKYADAWKFGSMLQVEN